MSARLPCERHVKAPLALAPGHVASPGLGDIGRVLPAVRVRLATGFCHEMPSCFYSVRRLASILKTPVFLFAVAAITNYGVLTSQWNFSDREVRPDKDREPGTDAPNERSCTQVIRQHE